MPAFRSVVLIAWLALPLQAYAAEAKSKAASPAIAEFLDSTMARADADGSLEERLVLWAGQGATVAQLEANTVRDYAVPPALAHGLVALSLRYGAIWYDDDKADELDRIEKANLALVDRYPGVWLAFEEAARKVGDGLHCDGGRIDAVVAKWSDPDAARLRLAPVVGCPQLLAPRTQAAGANAEPFAAFARHIWDEYDAPLGLAALRVASAKADADPSMSAEARGEMHALRLRRELQDGRLSAAIAALPAEDSPLFAATLAQLSGSERLELAAAAAATGQPGIARRWRELADMPGPAGVARSEPSEMVIDAAAEGPARPLRIETVKVDDQKEAAKVAQRKELLAWALGERKGDPFALLAASDDDQDSFFKGEAWTAVHAAVAVREGYPMLATKTWMPDAERAARQRQEALEECYRCAPELLAAIAAVGKELETRDAASPVIPADATGDDRPAELLARIDRAIDGPPLPWVEQPLPPAMRTARKVSKGDEDCMICGGGDAAASAAPPWKARLPRGELVRWARAGARIVAITASQTLDPVGELSSGGYWVSVSDDAGATFAPPLYTGLRVYAPYVVRPDSKLPLLDGDTLQLEVAVRELDAEKVMLPPISLPLKRRADDLFLRIALADLRRDGDDDGVPDPIEAAMLLDPAAADTDGDGIADGADMLPNVPWRASANDDRVAALAVAMEQVFGKEFGAIITTAAHAGGGDPATSGAIGVGSTASNDRAVVFLQAPADALAGMQLQKPVVVLSGAQVERLRKVRGAFYPIQIGGFAINRAGDEGVVWWSAGWTGGSFRLHKRDGKWVAETKGSWITGAPAPAPALAAR